MKLIDRLLLKATGGGKQWSMLAFVDDCAGGYEAHYSFWDGVPGSGGQYPGSSHHATRDKAIEAIKQAAREFPHPLAWSNIIVDDYGPDPGSDTLAETS